MQTKPPFREYAKVEMHLDGGFTRIVLFQIADGHHRWDIPTDKIPIHLRRIGSEFLVVMPRFTPEATDLPDAIREMCRQIQVEEIMR